jgi:hypothetical protein
MSKTDEFNALYNLLANLSAKKVKPITAANTAATTATNALPIEIQNTIENPIENTDTVDNEVIDNIVPFIKQKRTYTRRKPTHSDLDKEPPILEKEGMQCKSCLLSVPSEGALIVHYDKSPLCRKWAFLPDEMQEPVPVKTVYQLAMEYVRQSITADKELTCKFCKNSFMSLEQHHAHYQTTVICNRMAHLEFKRILKNM